MGRVVDFDERSKTIVLDWPKGLSPYNFCNPQPFSSGGSNVLEDVTILDTNEVFVHMLEMYKYKLEFVLRSTKDAVGESIGRLLPTK